MRREVINALAALSDRQYQKRVWIDHILPQDNYYDDLTLNIHILYDDCAVLPEPETRIGTVLVDGDEIGRLIDLERVLGPMIAGLGEAPDVEYMADPRWSAVLAHAGSALSAMVLAGEL